jgi:hypothetical protein
VHAEWFAWNKCVASSPAQCAQVQENPLLTSSSSPLTGKVHFPRYYFLHCWDSMIKMSAVLIIQCPTVFLNSGDNEENRSLKGICVLIYYMTKLDFQQITCRFKPCCIPRTLATTSRQSFHAIFTLLCRMRSKCLSLKGLGFCWLQKTFISFFQHW